MWKISIIAAVLFIYGCGNELSLENQTAVLNEPDVSGIEMRTDKDIYHSNELMKVEVEIDSENELDNCQLAVYGIEVRGKPKMYHVVPMNLTVGSNLVMYGYKMPACNKCAGVNPGNYSIHAELYYNNTLVIESIGEVRLVQ